MANVIPTELRNPRGLQKLKDFYAEQLCNLNGNENARQLTQLRSDIETIEQELEREPLIVSAVAQK